MDLIKSLSWLSNAGIPRGADGGNLSDMNGLAETQP